MSKIRPTQVYRETFGAVDSRAFVTQVFREVWGPVVTASPATPTGAGVTQVFRETFVATSDPGSARVTGLFRETWAADTTPDPVCPPSGGGQHGYVTIS